MIGLKEKIELAFDGHDVELIEVKGGFIVSMVNALNSGRNLNIPVTVFGDERPDMVEYIVVQARREFDEALALGPPEPIPS